MEKEGASGPCRPSSKPTPLQLREQYHSNIAKLARKARVEPCTIYFMMMGCPIARQYAEQILATSSAELGQSYTLEHVQVALLPEEEGQAKLAESEGTSGTEEEGDSG